MTIYIPTVLETKLSISGENCTVIPINWADGMVGALPAFKSKEDAEVYCVENNISTSIYSVEVEQR